MFEHFQWWPFLLAVTVLTLSPGVDTLLVIRNASVSGWRVGLLTSLGICMGLFVHATISAAGLSVILLGSAEWFMLLKLAGAAYLCWLGVQSLVRAWRARRTDFAADQNDPVRPVVALRQGMLSNVLNPKPIVFYMALFPQFVDPEGSALVQSFMMAAVHFAIGMLWLGLVSLMVDRARGWLQSARATATLEGAAGAVLVALGVRMGAN